MSSHCTQNIFFTNVCNLNVHWLSHKLQSFLTHTTTKEDTKLNKWRLSLLNLLNASQRLFNFKISWA